MEIQQLIVSPKYNFLLDLLKFLNISIESVDVRKLINTLELFTFGNYYLYNKYSNNYIQLQDDAALKLLELSIISYVTMHENSTVPIGSFFDNELGINLGVNRLNLSSDDPYVFLEKILISMVDKKLIEVMIDNESDSVIIRKTKIIRDAYNLQIVQLMVLLENDLSDININNSKKHLEKWMNDQICSVKEDLGAYDEEDSKQVPLSRKRKLSDNAK